MTNPSRLAPLQPFRKMRRRGGPRQQFKMSVSPTALSLARLRVGGYAEIVERVVGKIKKDLLNCDIISWDDEYSWLVQTTTMNGVGVRRQRFIQGHSAEAILSWLSNSKRFILVHGWDHPRRGCWRLGIWAVLASEEREHGVDVQKVGEPGHYEFYRVIRKTRKASQRNIHKQRSRDAYSGVILAPWEGDLSDPRGVL